MEIKKVWDLSSKLFLIAVLSITLCQTALADKLILTTGREITGDVTKTDEGYTIKTRGGVITIQSAEVAQWVQDAATPAPTATGGAPLSTGGAPTAIGITPTSGSSPSNAFSPARMSPKPDPALVTARATVFVRQGIVAVQADAMEAALENFLDAKSLLEHNGFSLDPSNPGHYAIMTGGGAAYLYLSRYDRANDLLEPAYGSPFRDRTLMMNRAILDRIQIHRALRGVKDLTDMLRRESNPDEKALNLLGASLGAIMWDGKSPKTRVFQDGVLTYTEKNKELEETRPGMKHWGVDWMTKREFGKLQAKIDYTTGLFKAAEAVLKTADDALATAQRNSNQAHMEAELRGSKGSRNNVAVVDARLNAAQATYDAALADDQDKYRAIPRPDWPKDFPPEVPKLDVGMAVTQGPTRTQTLYVDGTPTPTPGALAAPKVRTLDRTPGAPIIDDAPARVTVTRYAVAVPVGPDLMVTAASPTQGAKEFHLETPNGDVLTAELVRSDKELGLSLLRVRGQRWPYLNLATEFKGGPVVCWGYPDVSVFAPRVDQLDGHATAPKADGWIISMRKNPRLPGTAILDKSGELVGICLGDRDAAASQMPAVRADQIRTFLSEDAPRSVCVNPDPAGILQLAASW